MNRWTGGGERGRLGSREGGVDLECLDMSVANVELASGGRRTLTVCPPFIFAGKLGALLFSSLFQVHEFLAYQVQRSVSHGGQVRIRQPQG